MKVTLKVAGIALGLVLAVAYFNAGFVPKDIALLKYGGGRIIALEGVKEAQWFYDLTMKKGRECVNNNPGADYRCSTLGRDLDWAKGNLKFQNGVVECNKKGPGVPAYLCPSILEQFKIDQSMVANARQQAKREEIALKNAKERLGIQ